MIMNEPKSVLVKELAEYFNIEQITGDKKSLNREIVLSDTNRPGLELAGYYEHSQVKRLMILGDKEIAYIETMSKQKQRKSFDFITDEKTPAIIISKGHECPPILKRVAKRKNFPIFKSVLQTNRLIVNVSSFLDEKLATSQSLHGGLLSIYGKGVLIRGESGMGKSEIALELIKRGHLLVADDRVDCYRIHNQIIGKAPELLQGMLELRGVGIINISRMFGVGSVLPKAQIDFEVVLEPWDSSKDYDRVGIEDKKEEEILGIGVPKIILPVREGRNMAVIIESAVTNYLLGQMGLDSAKEFEQRVLDFIEKNK